MELAVVQAAERNGEFVAYLAPKGDLLGEAHVVRVGGLTPADEAGSGSDVLQMILVAVATHLPEGEDAFVDAAVRGSGPFRCRDWWLGDLALRIGSGR